MHLLTTLPYGTAVVKDVEKPMISKTLTYNAKRKESSGGVITHALQ